MHRKVNAYFFVCFLKIFFQQLNTETYNIAPTSIPPVRYQIMSDISRYIVLYTQYYIHVDKSLGNIHSTENFPTRVLPLVSISLLANREKCTIVVE